MTTPQELFTLDQGGTVGPLIPSSPIFGTTYPGVTLNVNPGVPMTGVPLQDVTVSAPPIFGSLYIASEMQNPMDGSPTIALSVIGNNLLRYQIENHMEVRPQNYTVPQDIYGPYPRTVTFPRVDVTQNDGGGVTMWVAVSSLYPNAEYGDWQLTFAVGDQTSPSSVVSVQPWF
ncbi:hypothetical protein ACGFYF_40500 [Streptomyces lavendulae]|uniref:hypothetical protein n=1 Tax=Streptomyces lavendulae TaxID=1914 RepID=UPI003719337D